MADNLEHEFFTKVKGWVLAKTQPDNLESLLGWYIPPPKNEFQCYQQSLPPISTSWDAFHEWVVPELRGKKNLVGVKKILKFTDYLERKLGEFYFGDKTPQRALEWAMQELQS